MYALTIYFEGNHYIATYNPVQDPMDLAVYNEMIGTYGLYFYSVIEKKSNETHEDMKSRFRVALEEECRKRGILDKTEFQI